MEKKEHMTHDLREISIEPEPEITEMVQLAVKFIYMAIINISHSSPK